MARPVLLLLTLLGLVGCVEDACELDMTVSGSISRTLTWRDAECTLSPGYSWPAITIERDGYVLHIYTNESTFSPGSVYAEAEYFDVDGGYGDFSNCTLDLWRAELEPWTQHDHWILDGNLHCPDDPWNSIRLSSVAFHVYQAED